MRSSNLRPGHPQQSHGDPARNNVVPSEGMNSTSSTPLPSDAIYKPSPPYDPHSIDRPRPVNPLRHQPPQPETRSLWQLIRTPAVTAVVLLQVFLLLKCDDPLEAIIDLEPATRRASNENATLVLEKERAQREREVTAREKASWENAKEARIPHGAFWDVVSPIPYCEAYGKREYRGVLRNIPEGWDAIEACMSMPVVIKGVQLRRPDWCTRFMEFPRIRVAGYWMVDWDQPDCKPWFRDFKDRGCTGNNSGKRRIEAQFVDSLVTDAPEGPYWLQMCYSTPMVWDMITYSSPAACTRTRWGETIAMWDISDESCS